MAVNLFKNYFNELVATEKYNKENAEKIAKEEKEAREAKIKAEEVHKKEQEEAVADVKRDPRYISSLVPPPENVAKKINDKLLQQNGIDPLKDRKAPVKPILANPPAAPEPVIEKPKEENKPGPVEDPIEPIVIEEPVIEEPIEKKSVTKSKKGKGKK
jgi:hypothetical protein